MDKQNYTIRDIAKLAKVSRGTVDRVIHARGRVSEKAFEKVNKVLKEINYQPNLIARSLKSHKNNTIAVIIPNFDRDDYWRKCVEGVKGAEDGFKAFGGTINYHVYQRTKADYEKIFEKALEDQPDAILVAPIYYKESLLLFERLEEKEIPYALINTPIQNAGYKSFVGQDYRKSGRVAAQLMDTLLRKTGDILIIHVEEDFENSTHLHHKEEGFRSYFREQNKEQMIRTFTLHGEPPDISPLQDFIPTASGLFVTTSKTSALRNYVEDPAIRVVGYDLTSKNVAFLKAGKIDMLIHQNPYQQGYDGISFLAELLLYKKEPPHLKLLPIDIVTSENVDCYL